MRVFLDANILFSASFPNSHLAQFLVELSHHAVLMTTDYAIREAERNIASKEPDRRATHERFVASLEQVAVRVFDPGVTLADKDRPILCGAISGGADYLLTGDKRDFGHLFGTSIRGVKVVNVQLLLSDLVALGIIEK